MRDEKILHGWKAICAYLNKSIPTVIKYARKYDAPIAKMGATVFTTEERLDEWMENLLKKGLVK